MVRRTAYREVLLMLGWAAWPQNLRRRPVFCGIWLSGKLGNSGFGVDEGTCGADPGGRTEA